jgi:hypothetical protein
MRPLLIALFMLLVTGIGSTYMLFGLDQEAKRLVEGRRRWYGENKSDAEWNDEVLRVRRKIKILYATLVVGSIVAAVIFGVRILVRQGLL